MLSGESNVCLHHAGIKGCVVRHWCQHGVQTELLVWFIWMTKETLLHSLCGCQNHVWSPPSHWVVLSSNICPCYCQGSSCCLPKEDLFCHSNESTCLSPFTSSVFQTDSKPATLTRKTQGTEQHTVKSEGLPASCQYEHWVCCHRFCCKDPHW